MSHTLHEMKLLVLRAVASTSQAVHKFNLIGREGMPGLVEGYMRSLTPDERTLAVRAFDQLEADDLIRPTYADLTEPENWVKITDKGRQALESGLLDQLDHALCSISPHLLELRRGAWSALASSQPDSFRQAAHSAREMIDQTLREGAPGNATRKDRLKFLMKRFRGDVSESDLSIADSTIDLVLAIDNKLIAMSHARSSSDPSEVQRCVRAAEDALRYVLVAP